MADYVVDTNVWVWVDKVEEDEQCTQQSLAWIEAFIYSQERIVVDEQWLILNEYRKNILKGGLAEGYLKILYANLVSRAVMVPLELDADGYALVPSSLEPLDRSDRKFAAVALAHPDHPPIVNARDSDWEAVSPALAAYGIAIIQLCPEYLRKHRKD